MCVCVCVCVCARVCLYAIHTALASYSYSVSLHRKEDTHWIQMSFESPTNSLWSTVCKGVCVCVCVAWRWSKCVCICVYLGRMASSGRRTPAPHVCVTGASLDATHTPVGPSPVTRWVVLHTYTHPHWHSVLFRIHHIWLCVETLMDAEMFNYSRPHRNVFCSLSDTHTHTHTHAHTHTHTGWHLIVNCMQISACSFHSVLQLLLVKSERTIKHNPDTQHNIKGPCTDKYIIIQIQVTSKINNKIQRY